METFSALLAIYTGNSPVTGEFFATKASDAELLCFSLICVWMNGWVSNRETGDLRRYRAYYNVTIMYNTTQCTTQSYDVYGITVIRGLPNFSGQLGRQNATEFSWTKEAGRVPSGRPGASICWIHQWLDTNWYLYTHTYIYIYTVKHYIYIYTLLSNLPCLGP